MPAVSEAQRRAMFAAAEGRSTLGIPAKVGREFIGKDMKRSDWRGLIAGLVKFFTEEEEEPEHKEAEDRAEFREEDHPRDSDGKFGSGGGEGSATAKSSNTRYGVFDARKGRLGDSALITSQDFLDDDIVQEKLKKRDFDVQISPEFEIGGRKYRVILDGHHSLAAAEEAGVTPDFHEQDERDNDNIALLEKGDVDGFLEQVHAGSDYVNAITRRDAWDKAVAAADAKMGRSDLLVAASDMALDRASVRDKDADGRLHVEQSNISKANVCEYLGSEIPGAQALGLDPTRRYRLLRDPVELERAAPTFNRLPILKQHVPVTADTHDPALVIGATGENAKFEAPYLHNGLVFWPQAAIDDIESGEQCQLSSAYRYRADMTPGTYQGQPYDGVMRDIVGNHVALVREGRAGPDVVVGDSKENIGMSKVSAVQLLAQRAIKRLGLSSVSRDALALAMDEEMEGEDELDPNSALPAGLKKAEDEETEEEQEERKRNRAEDAKMGLACAGDEDPETEEERKERMERREARDRRAKDARRRMGRDETEKERQEREEGERAEDRRARDSRRAADARRARDSKKGKDEEMVDKKAMDAAIQAASDATARRVTAEVRQTEREIREAEQLVRPYVGELNIAFDSAEEVLRHAATALGIDDAKTIHVSALPTIIKMHPHAGARPTQGAKPVLGMDAAAVDGFNKRFPDAARITSV